MPRIDSMTAFSRAERTLPFGQLVWELRSVNHRYLEAAFKLPDHLRQLEPLLRERLRKSLGRGKVDCSLRLTPGAEDTAGFDVDTDQVKALAAAARRCAEIVRGSAELSAIDVLRWPGVLTDPLRDDDVVADTAVSLFDTALTDLAATRHREGSQLAGFINQRLDSIEREVEAVRSRLPALLAGQRTRLEARLAELATTVDQGRLEQEVVYLCQKADIGEELDRLATHITEVRRVLAAGGTCGRRLDFLMQELNREANTLSSKSISAETTLAAVEMKVLIEQMREQVQNIE